MHPAQPTLVTHQHKGNGRLSLPFCPSQPGGQQVRHVTPGHGPQRAQRAAQRLVGQAVVEQGAHQPAHDVKERRLRWRSVRFFHCSAGGRVNYLGTVPSENTSTKLPSKP